MTKSYQSLLDLNPLTTDAANFEGWTAADMLAHVDEEWRGMPNGDVRNWAAWNYKAAMMWLDSAAPSGNLNLDLVAERERGRVDVIRIALQICGWLIALRANPDAAPNLLPKLPDLYKPRERPLFKAAGIAFSIEKWMADNAATLLDTSRVRVAGEHGVRYLTCNGFDAADLKIMRSYDRQIAMWIDSRFERVTRIDGLMAA